MCRVPKESVKIDKCHYGKSYGLKCRQIDFREGMTSLVESVSLVGSTSSLFSFDSNAYAHKNRHRRHVLKSKENTYKHRCGKVLKRKLKKYKLRQDGGEDQDILDVSKILVSSLIIRSPESYKDPLKFNGGCDDFEELRPKNYLFKMVRRRNVKLSESLLAPEFPDKIDVNKSNDDYTSDTPETIANQEKKQTNAFKLLMDSRNKSIGSNSPGKEKSNDDCDQEFIEKKNIKAKRSLVLQKMAEAKGSLKKKELEESQEECIKQKMEKRAERFKSMILNDKRVLKKNKDDPTSNEDNKVKDVKLNSKEDKVQSNVIKKQLKTLQIVDIFNSIEEPIVIRQEKKEMSKEDKEFMKKLSPSLRKKESMMSYFKKIEKDSNDSDDNLIKVKLGSKTKRKGKKKKLSLNKIVLDNNLAQINDENHEASPNSNVIPVNNSTKEKQEVLVINGVNDRQMRKRNSKLNVCVDAEPEPSNTLENRPKRSVKRPIKYIDDAGISSSDEELHIFTPKKKKHLENTTDGKQTKETLDKTSNESKPRASKKVVKDKSEPKKPVKLAPIFKKQSLDPAALEAKQKFLQSGVPDKLKKIINQQKNNNIVESVFPVVVHVQQKEVAKEILNNKCFIIPEVNLVEEITQSINEENAYRKLLNLHQNLSIIIDSNMKQSTQTLIEAIKELYPKFPAYRTYRYLRGKSKGEYKDFNYVDLDNSIEIMNGVVDVTSDGPERLSWTDKYKALTTSQIIGNFESIKELRKWLVTWTENEMKIKSKNMSGSDSSDYYQSDTDSRESAKSMNNLLIVTGPTGSGKTSCVYAVAAELAMKVIEVNASSKRTGKIMLQDLQEATQSHKVNRGTLENSQKLQEKTNESIKNVKKRGRPKRLIEKKSKKSSLSSCDTLSGTPSSQESVRTDMSLILIDDADIVFEQDDGFSSAIMQLAQCSKRPVILVTSSLICPHLQRFIQNGKILKMYPLLPRMLGTWLDIMCLADNGICWPGVGAKFLNYFKGDIRKTINYLQFYTAAYVSNSDEDTASQNTDTFKVNIDDENSSMSWADSEGSEGQKCIYNNNVEIISNKIWNDFIDEQSNLTVLKQPMDIFNIWWSIPTLVGIELINNEIKKLPVTHKKIEKLSDKKESIMKLEAIANAIDALSLTDYFIHMKPDTQSNITSDPWYSVASDSVSELDNLDSYTRSYEVVEEISHSLVSGSILAAQSILCCDKKSPTNIHSPGMTLQRQRDKVISRHKSLTSYINPSVVLDRRALAMDYWSSFRTICRTEKTKTDINMKRNNRFCHYLKSVNVLCKSETFDNLCDSLCSNERSELCVTSFNE